MKVLLVAPLLPTALLASALLAGCGGGSTVAHDPAPSSSAPSASSSPSSTPADGPPAPVPTYLVRTADLVTVLDAGQGPMVCFGPVAESHPPQCTGPAALHWKWGSIQQGMYDEQGQVRWGQFELTGTWDGTAFTVDSQVPGPVYDPAAPSSTPTPAPATTYPPDRLQQIAAELRDELPGLLTAYDDTAGHVAARVIYDDGSLQAWVDQKYGRDVVLVSSALIQLGRA